MMPGLLWTDGLSINLHINLNINLMINFNLSLNLRDGRGANSEH